MSQICLSDVLKIVIVSMLLLILVFVWTGFVMLDKKLDRTIEQQAIINQCSYKTNEEQAKSIRVLHTDVDVLMRLATKGIYTEEEE